MTKIEIKIKYMILCKLQMFTNKMWIKESLCVVKIVKNEAN